jgi:hypothetical protein
MNRPWRRQSEEKGSRFNFAERGKLTLPDAEKCTGITNQQVSKWAKRLEAAA